MNPLGILEKPTEWTYTEKYRGAGNFQIWLPLTVENVKLCSIGNLVWIKEKDAAMVIELIQTETSTSGAKIMIQGYTLENILSKRIVWGLYTKSDKPSILIEGLVNDQIVSPTNENRKYPNLAIENYQGDTSQEKSVQYQCTGNVLSSEVSSLCELYGYGYRVKFKSSLKSLTFSLYKGTDRGIKNGKVSPVVLSTDFENLLSSEYQSDHMSYKNVALVQGMGEGNDRTSVTINDEMSGNNRIELYVDARDLQNTDENGFEISEEDYKELLTGRGNSMLNESKIAENFSTEVNTLGNMQYNRDYFLGDIVTVQDRTLGLQLSALVSEVEHSYSTLGYSINITFGYGQSTLIDKLRRRL